MCSEEDVRLSFWQTTIDEPVKGNGSDSITNHILVPGNAFTKTMACQQLKCSVECSDLVSRNVTQNKSTPYQHFWTMDGFTEQNAVNIHSVSSHVCTNNILGFSHKGIYVCTGRLEQKKIASNANWSNVVLIIQPYKKKKSLLYSAVQYSMR